MRTNSRLFLGYCSTLKSKKGTVTDKLSHQIDLIALLPICSSPFAINACTVTHAFSHKTRAPRATWIMSEPRPVHESCSGQPWREKNKRPVSVTGIPVIMRIDVSYILVTVYPEISSTRIIDNQKIS